MADLIHTLWTKDSRPVTYAPAMSGSPFRITVVCLGNICRSPIGEVVLRDRIDRAGLAERVIVDSAGTGDWHVGQGANPRSLAVLDAHGYQHDHRARQITSTWLPDIDLLLAMDVANFEDLQAMRAQAGVNTGLRMIRSFDPALVGIPEPSARLDVPDPYHGTDADFLAVLHMIEVACDGLIEGLPTLMDPR
jgi:protein-tyrosine phosphatase